ncbi:MAG: hypothetical protein ACRYGG_08590 [Janthinobacterium lividum]
MSLDPSVLSQGFANIGQPTDAGDAAAAIATIYEGYAQNAVDPAGNPLVSGNTVLFATGLIRWLSANYVTTESAAEAFAYAIAQFWSGATFQATLVPSQRSSGGNGVMSTLATSIVTDVHTTRLETAITNLNVTNLQSVADACAAFAQALHNATTSGVYVKMTGSDSNGVSTIYLGNPS